MKTPPPLQPWQDPEQFARWCARPEDQRSPIRLSQLATETIWKLYNKRIVGFVMLTFEGEIWAPTGEPLTALPYPLGYDAAVEFCRGHHTAAYSLHNRKAWRIVWGQGCIEQRTRTNYRFEPVDIMGYKGLSDQWIDRPRVKMFANDF